MTYLFLYNLVITTISQHVSPRQTLPLQAGPGKPELIINTIHRAPTPLMTSAIDATKSFLTRRDGMGDPSKFPLYVFAIIVGCVAFVLIGCSIWSMYYGDDSEVYIDIPAEQRKYMRLVRLRSLNSLAVQARRPDMILPIHELEY